MLIFLVLFRAKCGIMRNPFLIVLVILMVPITPVIMLGMVVVVVVAAFYSILREAIEGLGGLMHIGHHPSTA